MSDEPSGDIFDPEVVIAAEAKAYDESETTDNAVDQYIRRRLVAYANVFSVGPTTQDNLDFVLADLAVWSRAYSPTWNKDQKVQDLMEGRRELYMRIMEITRLPHEMQYRKYMDAVTRNMKA